jgi:5-methyltetrahydrofolate--homocysteine methyltransferase
MGPIKKIKQDLLTLLEKRTLICDGAMGTSLQALGYKGPGDLLNLDHSALESISSIHLQYIEAGSDIIQTNTLGASPAKLEQSGSSGLFKELNIKGVAAARAAVQQFNLQESQPVRKVFIAGDIGPSGKILEPYGDTKYQYLVDSFASQAQLLAEYGADLIIIETMIDLNEALAAVEGTKKAAQDILVACTMSFTADGVTVMGNRADKFGKILIDAGCDIIGANCSVGSDSMIKITEKIRNANPGALLLIQPNAGIPSVIDGKTVFNETSEMMAENFEEILKYNISIAGACCGSTPEHIRKISEILKKGS